MSASWPAMPGRAAVAGEVRRMITRKALDAAENGFVTLPAGLTLRDAVGLLLWPELGIRSWWHLVVARADGSWAAARLSGLVAALRADPARRDERLGQTGLLLPAATVEAGSLSLEQARHRLRSAPESPLVVTRDGALMGILVADSLRGGAASDAGLRDLVLAAPPPDAVDPAPACVRRYGEISCPRRILLGSGPLSAVVRLTLAPSPLGGSTRPLDLALDLPVQVRFEAPGFERLGEAVQEIRLLPDRDSSPAAFDLLPLAIGRYTLSCDFFQAGSPLGTAALEVEVVRDAGLQHLVQASRLLAIDHGIAPPERVLRVVWDEQARTLSFTLVADGGGRWIDFPAVALRRDLGNYAAGLFEMLTAIGSAPRPGGTAEAVLQGNELKTVGQNLWNLLPEALRNLYAGEREGWRGRSLLILSDEPHLPWELLWPHGKGRTQDEPDWEDALPWCAGLRLSRWLRSGPGEGVPAPPGRLPLQTLACVAPGDTHLPAVPSEARLLRGLADRHRLRYLSPKRAILPDVLDLLGTGGYDWLHVASHGNFDAALPDERSVLKLEGQRALAPHHLVGPRVAGHLRRYRPGFFLNTCHSGRAGLALTGLGGWAGRLVAMGAGLFLGTLWTVADRAALGFARIFYDRLESHATVAEALRSARLALHATGDPGWLAYSVYGHPNARVEIADLPGPVPAPTGWRHRS
jgi:hypothetical protein